MNERLIEIEKRLAEITASLKSADDGNDIPDQDSLINESRSLRAERDAIAAEEAKRQERLKEIADNTIQTSIVEERKDENTMPNYTVDSAEYRSAFLKKLMGKELNEQERTVNLSGALPTSTANKVISIVEKSPLLSKVSISSIAGNLNLPVETAADEASWGASGAASNETVGVVNLYAYQLIKTIEVPGTVKAGAIDAFEDYIVRRLGEKIRKALEAAVINGNGTGKATGINVTVTTLTGTFTKAAFAKADLFKIMGALSGEYQDNACFVMPSKVFYGEVVAVAGIDNFNTLAAGPNGVKLMGKDVVLTENAVISNADYIFYGDPSKYFINFSEDINVSKDESVGFATNSIMYRGVCVCDGKLADANAFVKFTRAT